MQEALVEELHAREAPRALMELLRLRTLRLKRRCHLGRRRRRRRPWPLAFFLLMPQACLDAPAAVVELPGPEPQGPLADGEPLEAPVTGVFGALRVVSGEAWTSGPPRRPPASCRSCRSFPSCPGSSRCRGSAATRAPTGAPLSQPLKSRTGARSRPRRTRRPRSCALAM